MSFIKELNLGESNLLEQVITMHLKGSEFLDEHFVKKLVLDFQDIYNLLMRYNNDDNATIGYIRYKTFKAVRNYNKLGYVIEDMNKQFISEINKLFLVFSKDMQSKCKSNVEKQMCMRRMKLTIKRTNNIKNDIGYSALTELNSIIKEVVQELIKLEDKIPLDVKVQEENIKVDKDFKTQKIFSYKEMCKLAEENDYVYLYTNGSHRIYKHRKSCRIVTIPNHTLPKSLSIGIQKQINARKVN